MFSTVFCAGLSGIDGYLVSVECNASNNLSYFDLVGLPDMAVKEAKERVRTACANSGFRFPSLELMVNLAPADRRKEGSAFDVAILLAILRCGGILRPEVDLSKKCFAGELSLSGAVRPIRGALCLCAAAKENGMTEFYAPAENAAEAAAVEGMKVFAVRDMASLVAHLSGVSPMEPVVPDEPAAGEETALDFSDIRGQQTAKRAMEIAAAGGHNILLIGPPGTGKSMLAKRLPTILPPMTFAEAIEATKIHSVSGTLPESVSLLRARPFRSPHHTMSPVSLVGGGINPLPGEVSLAHNGVLFLDEFPEFPKQVTDSLRQPIEDRQVTITRANGRVTYPCSFMLVAAMNPCRCGYFGASGNRCRCSPQDVARYVGKISGPMLDRIDIQIELPLLSYEEIREKNEKTETSAEVRARVTAAREFALERMGHPEKTEGIFCNAQLSSADIRKYCPLTDDASNLLKTAFERLGMSVRGYDRVMRVARTIADLDRSDVIGAKHIAEAIGYRSLDKKYWSR